MAEAGDAGKGSRSRGSRKPPRPEKRTTPTPGSGESAEPTPSSSGSNPLGLDAGEWTPPDQPTPADPGTLDDYEAPPPIPLEWTPERAGAVVRAGGFLLHTADGASREPGGEELWRATEADLDAIAPPLARILNRYEPARRLAGVSDEMELAVGLMGYARRNLADRGRVVTSKREREEQQAQAAAGESWPAGPQAPPPPE